jgi:hypothetical protein
MKRVVRNVTQKAIVTTLITTLLSGTVSLLLGFYLGHALQQPRLKIVDLEQSYYHASHNMPESVTKELASQPLVVNALREALMRAAEPGSKEPCTGWLDGEPWKDKCLTAVSQAARGLAGSLRAETDMPSPEFLKSMRLSEAQRELSAKSLQHLIEQLDNFTADNTMPYTGEADFDIGVLNTGDLDGVVGKTGKITLQQSSFSIHSDHYTVVKAHGFETIQFSTLTSKESEQKALETWRTTLDARRDVEFQLSIQSGENKTLTATAKPFRSGLQK